MAAPVKWTGQYSCGVRSEHTTLTETTSTRVARLGNDTVVDAAPSAGLLFNRVGNSFHGGVILGGGKESRDSAESVHDGFVCL